MKYAKGIMWLDDCRIPFVDDGDIWKGRIGGFQDVYVGGICKKHNEDNTKGRFTPNLLVCDDVLNDGSVSEAKANENYKWNKTNSGSEIFIGRGTYTPRNDKGTNSRYYDLDMWFDKMIEKL